jgi:two-component system response regulator FlrC
LIAVACKADIQIRTSQIGAKHCLGNRTHAANVLGISIRTLRNKLNEYSADGVRGPPPGGGEPRAAA